MPLAAAPSSFSFSSARRTPAGHDISFTFLRWVVYLASCVCILNWWMLPAALDADRAEAMSASMEVVHSKRGDSTQLLFRGRDSVWVDCFDARSVCQAPRLRRDDRWDVLVQRVGLFDSAWLLEAARNGTPVADRAVQARAYQRHKALLGWLSLFAAALSALLVWAGPYRSPDPDQGDLLTW